MGLVLVSVAALVSGCYVDKEEGSGVLATETRVVGGFDRLEIDTVNAKIAVDPSKASGTIEVKGDDNLVRRVRAHVESGKLIVDAGDEDVDAKAGLEVILHMGNLTKIEASGTSRVELEMETPGALEIHASGEARITGKGRVGHLEADIAGDSEILFRDLRAHSAEITAAGSSFAEVCAEDELDADAAGTADVDYYCNPNDVDKEESSGGEVHRR
jgi:hypothetical protein